MMKRLITPAALTCDLRGRRHFGTTFGLPPGPPGGGMTGMVRLQGLSLPPSFIQV